MCKSLIMYDRECTKSSLRCTINLSPYFNSTNHWKCQLAKKRSYDMYHLSGVVVDLLEVQFLPLGKKTIQPFSRAGGIQAKWPAKYGPNGLCVLAAISEKAGWFFCPGVKIEPPVGPQQPQIGGIESSFFLANWYFQ